MKKLRKCGQCTAPCCINLKVPSLDKPAGEKCVNLSRTGCKIYNDRPEECRGFQCMWTEGFLPNSARPDKTGIMAYRHVTEWGDTVTLLEFRVGAFQRNARHINTIQQLVDTKGWALIVVDAAGRSAAMVPEDTE